MTATLSSLRPALAAAWRIRWLKLAIALGAGSLALSACHYYDPYYNGPYYNGPYYGPPAVVAPRIYIGPGYRGSYWRGNYRGGRRWR